MSGLPNSNGGRRERYIQTTRVLDIFEDRRLKSTRTLIVPFEGRTHVDLLEATVFGHMRMSELTSKITAWLISKLRDHLSRVAFTLVFTACCLFGYFILFPHIFLGAAFLIYLLLTIFMLYRFSLSYRSKRFMVGCALIGLIYVTVYPLISFFYPTYVLIDRTKAFYEAEARVVSVGSRNYANLLVLSDPVRIHLAIRLADAFPSVIKLVKRGRSATFFYYDMPLSTRLSYISNGIGSLRENTKMYVIPSIETGFRISLRKTVNPLSFGPFISFGGVPRPMV